MSLLKKSFIASIVALGLNANAFATTLDITGNFVTGAHNVNVNGTFYDVQFGQNTDFLSNNSVFAGYDKAKAGFIADALWTQVFSQLNGQAINGCEANEWCWLATMFNGPDGNSFVANYQNGNVEYGAGTADDINGKLSYIFSEGYTGYSATKWTLADATTSATAVPELDEYVMMLAGLGLIGFAARRKLAR